VSTSTSSCRSTLCTGCPNNSRRCGRSHRCCGQGAAR
jgi:hypothetical protein